MATELTVTTEPPEHKLLVALAPQDVPAAQAELKGWCEQRIVSLHARHSDLADQVRIAKTNQWAATGLTKLQRETVVEIEYYEKIRAAVEQGYLVVPNFDVDIMALRVLHGTTPAYDSDKYSARRVQETRPSEVPVLAAGIGEYVNPHPKVRRAMLDDPTKDDPGRTVAGWASGDEFKAIAFPATMVKPVILEATALALSRKVFDSIGVVNSRTQDPIVLGTIYHPKDRNRNRRVSFFVAWWLDTRTL